MVKASVKAVVGLCLTSIGLCKAIQYSTYKPKVYNGVIAQGTSDITITTNK